MEASEYLAEIGICPHTPNCDGFVRCTNRVQGFRKISVLVPTRGRVDRLRKMITSFEETADSCVELVFRVDVDDQETQDFLCLFDHHVVVGPHLHGYRSMPIFYNEMLTVATGDVLMCGNDDMVFRTFGWPSLILAKANEYPDGLFDIGVSTHNETHYPFSVVSRVACDRLGFLWDPNIFWGDMFLRDTMAWLGRTVMLPSVRIDHEWAGYPYDVLHWDPTYWTETHHKAVESAVEKLKELLS